jgi:hypothetical protein
MTPHRASRCSRPVGGKEEKGRERKRGAAAIKINK